MTSTAASRVEVWHSGQPKCVLKVIAGNVEIDSDRSVRRSLAVTLVDPTGELAS